MTFLPIVEILQGDVTGYIPTNIISMTDGQVYFSTALFNKGFKPAIDLGLSVSRIGSKAQWPGMRDLTKSLRLDYLQYLDLVKMTQLRATGLSKDAEARLRRGEAISHILVQDKNKPVSVEQQIIFLHTLGRGILDNLSTPEIEKYKQEFPSFVQRLQPDFLTDLRKTKEFSDPLKAKLDQCLKEYFKEKK